jgi:hypothetical protein
VHVVLDVHDTPHRALWVTPGGLGVGRMVQLLPFQRSVKAWLSAKPPE